MRILLVSQEFPPDTPWGGIGTQTRNKAVALAKLGHDVHVLSRARHDGPDLSTVQDEGVTVHRMCPPGIEFPIYGRSSYLLGYAWQVFRHLQMMAQEHPFDLVDFPEFGGEGFVYQLDRTSWNWMPVVVQLHGPTPMFTEFMDWPDPDTRYAQYATFTEELSVRRADALMACSANIADLASRYYRVPREEIEVVHCGVDAERFSPCVQTPRATRPTVLFVGNIVENKGIHTVFEAVMQLRGKYPDILLQVLGKIHGNDDLMQDWQVRLKAEHAQQHVEFLGRVDPLQLPDFYRRASLFSSPAIFEGGVANVYLEAMACECPVVASTAGGGPEAVIDGVTGRLVPPEDVAATVAAFDELLSSPERQRKLGAAGRARVDEYFAMDKYVARVMKVYERAVERSNQHPDRWEDIRE